MTKSSLLLRSIAVVVSIAGFAHLFACNFSEATVKAPVEDTHLAEANDEKEASEPIVQEEAAPSSKPKTTKGKPANTSAKAYNPETDYIIGKWRVAYDSDEFKGAVVYDIKKQDGAFNGYTVQYEDENGYSQKAEGDKVLEIKKFDGYKGKGIYMIEYEGEKYDIECQIDMVDENTFKLSYDYYGYSDVETWKRF